MVGLENLSKLLYGSQAKPKTLHNTGLTPPSPFYGKINNTNLAPLQRDTVSFTGRRNSNLNEVQDTGSHTSSNWKIDVSSVPDNLTERLSHHGKSDPAFADNAAKAMDYQAFGVYKDILPVASDVHKEAKRLETLFDIKMSIFDTLVGDTAGRTTKTKSIASKTMRVKSSQSIAKKMSAKVAKLMKQNNGYPVQLSPALVKSEIHDLLGARLVLAHGTNSEVNSIINRLIESIETGNGPKIKTIKNYGSRYRYLGSLKSDQLEMASYKAFGHYPEVVNKRKTSGYTATHIIVEMANGIDAEIQIFGRGVEKVKEIDDICYKGLQGKSISGLPEISKALKMVSKKPELKLEFDKYLTSAYELAKTQWDAMPAAELAKQKFPSINAKILPACLDLNHIAAALKEKALKSVKVRRF